jgi:hypothetical protein
VNLYGRPRSSYSGRRTTLEELKEQMYSLNMRLRLSLQNNDEKMRASLEHQIQEVQQAIEDMSSRNGRI